LIMSTDHRRIELPLFYKIIGSPFLSGCKQLVKLGGSFDRLRKLWDGGKFVCLDDVKNDCVVYSLGINDEVTFDEYMAAFGENSATSPI